MKTPISLILLSLFSCTIVYSQDVHPRLTGEIQKVYSLVPDRDSESLLYEQLEQPSFEGGVPSQMFLDHPTYTCQASDDFFVPEGLPWKIELFFILGYF